jgi:hypothetical protein
MRRFEIVLSWPKREKLWAQCPALSINLFTFSGLYPFRNFPWIAAITSARLFFFGGRGLFRRTRRKRPLPSSSQANTSPGRAPGITTRLLLSAITVMVG